MRPEGLRFKKTVMAFVLLICLSPQQTLGIDTQPQPAKSVENPAKVSISTGVTYLEFSQSFSSGTNRNLRFESLDVPNFNVLFETMVSESSFVKINFLKFTPSTTDSNTSTAVEQKTLGISSLGVDYNYLPFTSKKNKFLKRTGVLAGFQFASLPLLLRTSATSVEGEIFWNTFLRLGLSNTFNLSKKLSFSSNFVYLLPLSPLSAYKLAAPSFMEAEFLLSRLIHKKWDVGLSLQYKKQSYEVSGTEVDAVTNQPFRAQQSNTYAVLCFQVGYIW